MVIGKLRDYFLVKTKNYSGLYFASYYYQKVDFIATHLVLSLLGLCCLRIVFRYILNQRFLSFID